MMLDLNKEREAFERFHAKECNCSYEDLKRQLDRQEALTGHRYLPTSPRHEAWLIWDAAWQEKAKAQAVPEDWVIVPQELPLDMALKIAKERIIEQPPVKDPVLNEILEKALKENLQYEQCRLIRDYKEMVKRLSESGADYE